MFSYICVTHASGDRARAELFCHTLARYGFHYESMSERDATAKRDSRLAEASLLIALTSRAAAETETVASDIRHALGRRMTVLLVSLEKNTLDGRFSVGTAGPAVRIPYPEGDAPDRHAVSLFVHRLFVRHLARRFDCLSPARCAADVYGRTVLCAMRAHSGDREAMYELGRAYERGEGVPTLEVEAAYWLDLAAKAGVPDARIRMGELSLLGQGTDRDAAKAFALFTAAAEEGDERGDYHRGLCYLEGFGVVRDPVYAVECLRRAADRGYAPALYRLALLYRDGIGVKASFIAARDHLYAALFETLPKDTLPEEIFFSDASRPTARPLLSLYGRSRGVSYTAVSMRHLRRTHKALRDAAHRSPFSAFGRSRVTAVSLPEDGWLDATFIEGHMMPEAKDAFAVGRYTEDWTPMHAAETAVELARLLMHGSLTEGMTPSPTRALAWYRYAARLGHTHALYSLAEAYRTGRGVPSLPVRAARLFRLAADLGDVEAQFAYGVCCETGLGMPKDQASAVRFYQLSAEAGYPPAAANLGGCYERGDGVIRSQLTAVEWYARAAAEGLPVANCRLGLCYERGLGVTADVSRALRYYRTAAEAGHPYAAYRLALAYDRGLATEEETPSRSEIFHLYEEAARGGVPEASYALYHCYRDGCGVPPDGREALRHLKTAAESGRLQAAYEWGLALFEGEESLCDYTAAVGHFAAAAHTWSVLSRDADRREPETPHPALLTEQQAAGGAFYMLGFCALYRIGETGRAPDLTVTPTPDRVSAALPHLTAAASLGHAGALTLLGDLYTYGLMPTPDKAQAMNHYLDAARVGAAHRREATAADAPVNSLLSLADIARRTAEEALSEGNSAAAETAYVNMWRAFSEAVTYHSADAAVGMAECLYFGRGTSRNPAAAISWLLRAEELGGGRMEASLFRGDYLQSGGCTDAAEAVYRAALDAPSSVAECGRYTLHLRRERRAAGMNAARAKIRLRLAVIAALRGDGDMAFTYLSEAALAGDAEARTDLARMYRHATEDGRVVVTPEEKSARLPRKRRRATAEDTAPAAWVVAYYTALSPTVEPFILESRPSVDPAAIPAWMTAEVTPLDLSNALYFVGECRFYGRHLAEDRAAAVCAYRAALAATAAPARGPMPSVLAEASYSLGWCLFYGVGTPADPPQAIRLLTAASRTHADACYTLGLCREQGLGGTRPDAREAVKYYRKAYKLGHKTVARRILQLEKRLQGDLERSAL